MSDGIEIVGRRGFAQGLLAAGLATAWAGCTRGEPAPADLGAAPEFETRALSGDTVKLSDLRGTVVLLNVWATWCDPCVRELPVLADLHRELEPRGFTVLGLNTDSRSKLRDVQTMVAHNKLPFPVWLDFESESQTVFKLNGYPTSFLIDRKGVIRWRHEGEIARNNAELNSLLEQLL